jgi:hypothetical protein
MRVQAHVLLKCLPPGDRFLGGWVSGWPMTMSFLYWLKVGQNVDLVATQGKRRGRDAWMVTRLGPCYASDSCKSPIERCNIRG